jgi:predicted dehydrogenase
MQNSTRRTFIQAGAAMAVGAQANRILGANDRINVAVIGLGGRGTNHVDSYVKLETGHLAGLCDVNQAALEKAQARVQRATQATPKGYDDMRKVFEDKSIDAVSFATPNHWHALGSIWAMQAGKDVYCEKPASHNLFESAQMIAAARKYGRMCQIGSQWRTIEHCQKAVKMLNEGVIGKVYLAKGLCYKVRRSIGKKPDSHTPPGVDWSQFLGPAPMRPFNELRFRYNWHWFWDTGNGDLGNQGVHQTDIVMWGLGKTTLPKHTMSMGGKLVYDDDQETPNTQMCLYDWGDGVQAQFEVRGLPTGGEQGLVARGGNTIGNIFFGSDGWLSLDSSGFKVFKGERGEMIHDVPSVRTDDTKDHMQNFLDAVRSRKRENLNADIEIGARAAGIVHLANISYRLGRRVTWDDASHKFVGDSEANKMIARDYRKPYVVPEKV